MSKTEPKSWRDVIKIYPAADLFPMMSPDELKTLGEDIRANGFAHQCVFWTPDSDYRKWSEADCLQRFKRGEFYLLDGRNRVAALASLGYLDGWPDRDWPPWPPACDAYDPITLGPDTDPYRFILSANLHRRHLTAAQKQDLIAAELKAQPEKSNRAIAKQINVDHKTVGAVRDKLVSTGEIPRLAKTVGADGKARVASPRSTATSRADAATALAVRYRLEMPPPVRSGAANDHQPPNGSRGSILIAAHGVHEKVNCPKRRRWICQAISIIRR